MLVWRKSPIGLRCDQWDDTLDECEDECGLVPVGGRGESAQKISLFGGGGGRRSGGVRRGGWSGGGGGG